MNRILIITLLCFVIFLNSGHSQDNGNSFSYISKYRAITDSLSSDTIVPKKTSPRPFRMRKSPWLAVGLSAAVPGAGQFYNESYWKIPIILGVGGYLGYEIFRNNDRYNEYKELYEQSQTPTNTQGNLLLKEQRDDFRDKRDEFIIYFGVFYLINLIDAYVDAHLYDFDVSEDLRVSMMRGTELMKINFTF